MELNSGIHFISHIPRSAGGRILRHRLRLIFEHEKISGRNFLQNNGLEIRNSFSHAINRISLARRAVSRQSLSNPPPNIIRPKSKLSISTNKVSRASNRNQKIIKEAALIKN